MAVATTPSQKSTDLRIQRALAKPGAYGMKGFLLWTEAAWPKAIASQIITAANKYTPGARDKSTLASPQHGGFGDYAYGSLWADDASTDPTVPPVSGTTAATSSQPASNSWLADIGSAMQAATQAALAVTQVKDAQSIFNINLQRAQQGLSPIATNPSVYGLPAPTANIGLTSGTQNMVMVVGGLLAVALIGGGLAAGGRRK
jgi:hypothetical protein